jgi:predicted nucleotidyltransferase
MPQRLFSDRAKLEAICRRYAIRRIALFGSVLKGTARPDGDIDLLVEFESGHEPGLFRLAGIEAEFSALLDGRRVDLRMAEDLSSHFRAEILHTADEQYAA